MLQQASRFSFGGQDSTRQVRTTRSTDDYQEHTQITHIYSLPDTYIGSVEKEPRSDFLLDLTTAKMAKYQFTLPQGVERLFLEIISNSGDNADSTRRMGVAPGSIDVFFNQSTGIITVRNGGEPIPLTPMRGSTQEVQYYVPESIFGKLLTSSNYDSKIIRMGCGRNGFGAKVASIFSKWFQVKIGDPKNGQEWEGVWTNNMTEKMTKINPGHVFNGQTWTLKGPAYTGPSYVEVSYQMDFARFQYTEYPPEAISLFSRYTLDFGFTCKVPVSFNGTQYDVRNIKSYASHLWSQAQIDKSIIHYEWTGGEEPTGFKSMTKKQKLEYISNPPSVDFIPIVELMCIDTPDADVAISFVNGLMTVDGGVHVNEAYTAIGDHFLKHFNERMQSKKKGPSASKKTTTTELPSIKLTIADLKAHMSILLNCRLPDSRYKSQTKTYLTSPKPKITLSEDELKPLGSWDLFDRLSASLDAKLFKTIKKTEGKTRGRRVHLEKGIDANDAGTVKSGMCVLYIVEGKSAASYPKKRISYTPGNKDVAGYYPIKGKFPNITKMTSFQMAGNTEICDIKKMMGISEGLTYMTPQELEALRYGLIVITTDMDSDGTHIRMLLISFFRKYVGILQAGRVVYLMTFAVRLFDGNSASSKCVGRFPSVEEYEAWAQANPNHNFRVKYYKGLGTSRDSDIKDDTENAPLIMCVYDDSAPESLDMAFGKDNSDMRKAWIARWRDHIRTSDIMSVGASHLLKARKITDIINKDLIDYTIDALFRAIPSEEDLIKKSQRQALYFVLHHWKKSERKSSMKVDRIAGMAGEFTKYHHGPKSLIDTIIRMCQNYVGSNNLPYFAAEGQMGTRDSGGSDAADARYSETMPEWWLKEVINFDILGLVPKRVVEGEDAEPVFIPMDVPIGIVNGFSGIATGHSTYLPPHNFYEVLKHIYDLCAGNTPSGLKPYFKDFKGTVEVINSSTMLKFKISSETPENVDDLPTRKDDDEENEAQVEKTFKPPKRGKRTIVTKGIFEVLKVYSDNTVDLRVTELPIGHWIEDYHKWLETLEISNQISGFRDNSTTDTALFTIFNFKVPTSSTLDHKMLKLQSSFGYNNITLINRQGYPTTYSTVEEIVKVYFDNMVKLYDTMRLSKIKDLTESYNECYWKAQFVQRVVNDEIKIMGIKEADVCSQMTVYSIPHNIYDKVRAKDFNKEKIEALHKQMEKIDTEKKSYESTTPQIMWSNRLISIQAAFMAKKYDIA